MNTLKLAIYVCHVLVSLHMVRVSYDPKVIVHKQTLNIVVIKSCRQFP